MLSAESVKYAKNRFRATADGRVYRKGEMRYGNGEMYSGEWVDGKRHGKGVHSYRNGDKFVGEFEEGSRHGFGTLTFADYTEGDTIFVGKRYEGNWFRGIKQGHGLLIIGDGSSYEGNFECDKYDGRGTLTYKNGNRYVGEFQSGYRHGQGILTTENGGSYEGGFQLDVFHGRGRELYYKGGGTYVGTYLDGKRHGTGVRVFGNGNKYDGEFVNGEMHGEGVWTSYSGHVFVGQFERQRFHGYGVIHYSFGDKYEGKFMNGYIYGRGIYTWADGGTYQGEYMAVDDTHEHGTIFPAPNGKAHGYGERMWANGNKYCGDWQDGKLHGQGVYESSTSVYQGTFKLGQRDGHGVAVYGRPEGGKYECPLRGQLGRGKHHDGRGNCRYIGQWQRDEWHGNGMFTCADGTCYKGAFYRGERHGHGKHTIVPELERGDPRTGQYNAGGLNALYRVWAYEGDWENGTWHGQGSVTFSTWMKYQGTMRGHDLGGGRLEGRGIVSYADGHKVIAMFDSKGNKSDLCNMDDIKSRMTLR